MNEENNQNMRMNSNPVFNRIHQETITEGGYGASYKGIIVKTSLVFLALIVSAFGSLMLLNVSPGIYIIALIVSFIMATVSVFVASFSVRLAPAFTFVYAVAEGFILGLISALLAVEFSGIVTLAILITFGIFGGMLILYSTKLIVVTSRFRKVMMGVSLGILISMLLIGIFSLFDGGALWNATFGGNTALSLFITLLLIFYGAFMLVINFDNARMIVSNGIDKCYEWQVSLGLIVSTVYIYIQVLRLLAILFSRRD